MEDRFIIYATEEQKSTVDTTFIPFNYTQTDTSGYNY
jgi:hypothetical protein